jgi:outer membrane lipoprotein SlyB
MNSMIRISTLLSVCLMLGVAGCAPMTASTAYTPHVAMTKAVAHVSCTLRVVDIVDDRMDPTVLGSVGGRTVKGPSDPQAWLHSVIGGLRSTGIAVEFGDAETASAGLSAKAELKTAWVSSAATAKIASVVLNLQYFRSGSMIKSADYRGSISTPNWGSGQQEIQSMIDQAFDQALAQAAVDTLAACSAAVSSST